MCERPRNRSARDALPSSVSNRYSLSIRTHGSSCRRRTSSSLRRVTSFSASSNASRAVSHCSRVPVLWSIGAVPPAGVALLLAHLARCRSRDRITAGHRHDGSDKCGGIPVDSLITAAARALAAGDPLGALNKIALRDDAPALALRGIAMAQLGDLIRAKALVRSAARAFGPKEAVARARCVVAEAEIALVARDLGWPAKALEAARQTLEEHGDPLNAAHARYLEARRLILIGRLAEAERTLAELDSAPLPPASRAAHELVVAGVALRRLRTKTARAALARAARAARHARI